MYERILFPTDGSEVASTAFEYVLDLAADTGATVHVLNVADTTRDSISRIGEDVVDILEREGERIVESAADRAAGRGVEVVTDVRQGQPARAIVEYADHYDVDLVAMATGGREGVGQHLLGSVTERVVRTASVPVLTLLPDDDFAGRYPARRLLVPTDGSDCADAALETGIDLASATGAALDLLHVLDTTGLGINVRSEDYSDRLDAAAEEVLDEAERRAEASSIEAVARAVEHGPVVESIRSYVEANGVDLVVMGTHGRTGLDRYLLGSVAETVVRTSPVPVVTVRAPGSED